MTPAPGRFADARPAWLRPRNCGGFSQTTFLAFAGRAFPISASISAWLSLSHGREIIDALLSDRRRPRLFTDHGVDRLGAGYRLNAAMRQPPRWVERHG